VCPWHVPLATNRLRPFLGGGRFRALDHDLLPANGVQADNLALGEVDIAEKVPREVDAELPPSQRANRGGVAAAGPSLVDVPADDPRTLGIVELAPTTAAAEAREIPHDDSLPVLNPIHGQGVHNDQRARLADRTGQSLEASERSLRPATLKSKPDLFFPFGLNLRD